MQRVWSAFSGCDETDSLVAATQGTEHMLDIEFDYDNAPVFLLNRARVAEFPP